VLQNWCIDFDATTWSPCDVFGPACKADMQEITSTITIRGTRLKPPVDGVMYHVMTRTAQQCSRFATRRSLDEGTQLRFTALAKMPLFDRLPLSSPNSHCKTPTSRGPRVFELFVHYSDATQSAAVAAFGMDRIVLAPPIALS